MDAPLIKSLKPRVSVLLLAYRQASTVGDAVRSLLEQQCDETIELLLSDDASDDGTFEEMERTVAAHPTPHLVRLLRNQRNLGIGAHLNRLVEEARGKLLVIAAGDDISLPHRVVTLLKAWDATGQRVDLIASPLIDMAPDGSLHGTVPVDDLSQWQGIEDWVRRRPVVIGAGQAWTKGLHRVFGPFDPGTVYEDQIVTFRAMCAGGGITVKEPLVQYRRGGTSAKTEEDKHAACKRMRLQNQRHLVELEQLMRDAEVAGVTPLVGPGFKAEMRKQRYLEELLDAPGAGSRLGTFMRAGKVPFGWRIRKLWAALNC